MSQAEYAAVDWGTSSFRLWLIDRAGFAKGYGHGDARYEMRPVDSLTFDGEGLHGPESLVQLPVVFLTVTGYPQQASGLPSGT